LAPNAQFIIQDNNTDALDMGRKLVLRSPDSSLRSRISFEQHNFFEEQPVIADGYIFRHILHDWNDADSVTILKALLPALRPGAKVFISEGILPDPPARRINALTNKMILCGSFPSFLLIYYPLSNKYTESRINLCLPLMMLASEL
jgi:6-hydroxytryprostatin B O-methyltransferase